MAKERRLDELAREAGVATTTVRLYQSKGMLAPPRLEGRTGWYDEAHLRRLRLISRLQDQGFSLAAIASLIESWEQGQSLEATMGIEAELDALLGDRYALVVAADELADHLPAAALEPRAMQRAVDLGLVEVRDDGSLRIPDRRFLDTGTALSAMGVPMDKILDEWVALRAHSDDIARRFVGVFEDHLLPDNWQTDLDPRRSAELQETLARLRGLAHQILSAALDESLARLGRERLGALLAADSPETVEAGPA